MAQDVNLRIEALSCLVCRGGRSSRSRNTRSRRHHLSRTGRALNLTTFRGGGEDFG